MFHWLLYHFYQQRMKKMTKEDTVCQLAVPSKLREYIKLSYSDLNKTSGYSNDLWSHTTDIFWQGLYQEIHKLLSIYCSEIKWIYQLTFYLCHKKRLIKHQMSLWGSFIENKIHKRQENVQRVQEMMNAKSNTTQPIIVQYVLLIHI
jgi:hypothetical protein